MPTQKDVASFEFDVQLFDGSAIFIYLFYQQKEAQQACQRLSCAFLWDHFL